MGQDDMDFDHPPEKPLDLLRTWLEDALGTGLPNPHSMTLATIDPDGRPSARIVLLKGLDDRGAVFFTNRESRKGRGIAAHGVAALLFHWDAMGCQVLIEGQVAEIDDADSDAYFASRPRISQVGAWASRQSEPIADRAALDETVAEVERRYGEGPIPRPPHWGGYRVSLERLEFWLGREGRLHDRIVYRRLPDGSWTVERLCP